MMTRSPTRPEPQRQLREVFGEVTCPICSRIVQQAFINSHIDSGCTRHRCDQPAGPAGGSDRKRQKTSSGASCDCYGGSGGGGGSSGSPGAAEGSAAVVAPFAAASAVGSEMGDAGDAACAAENSPWVAAAPPQVWSLFTSAGRRQPPTLPASSDPALGVARPHALRWLSTEALSLPGACLWPLTSDGTSWVLHVPGWSRLPPPGFDALWSRHPESLATVVLFGKELTCSRWCQMYGKDYTYSGQTTNAKSLSEEETGGELLRCMGRICALVSVTMYTHFMDRLCRFHFLLPWPLAAVP
jgi:hypothetical protein